MGRKDGRLAGPLALIILDGFGWRQEVTGNAIKQAETPGFDELYQRYPSLLLEAAGEAVGLPAGQMGNSEVGHLNLGAGRVVYQDFTRISKAIADGSIKDNEVLVGIMKRVKERGTALHLLGLLSDGGVHSHIEHLFALLEMAADLGLADVFVHPVLDGRDVPPRSAARYLEELQNKLAELKTGRIASISGRYYTMDRDNRWERTEKAFAALVEGQGIKEDDPLAALKNAYARGESDEFVKPVVLVEGEELLATIGPDDGIVFFNFRADRARQITRALALEDFSHFSRPWPGGVDFVCMTEYDETFNLPVAFPPVYLEEALGEVVSKAGLKQLRIAETEKYAHVTFFFNGGDEKKFPGEERALIPSPKVATYDLQPEMSARFVKDRLLQELEEEDYSLVVMNFANPDMVGHTGDMAATIEAIQTVDRCIQESIKALLAAGGEALITGDHGNAEMMLDEKGGIYTAHTTNPVPFIYVYNERYHDGVPVLKNKGSLPDVAPTVLDILGLEKPAAMTGSSLLVK